MSSLPLMLLMHHTLKRIVFCLILLFNVMQACLGGLLRVKGREFSNHSITEDIDYFPAKVFYMIV